MGYVFGYFITFWYFSCSVFVTFIILLKQLAFLSILSQSSTDAVIMSSRTDWEYLFLYLISTRYISVLKYTGAHSSLHSSFLHLKFRAQLSVLIFHVLILPTRHCKNLFKKRAPVIQGFRDETTGRVLTGPNFMIEHTHRYYSQVFKESETSSQNQEVTKFKRTFAQRLAELPLQPFLFKTADLQRSIHRLKTKTSSGHEKVSNKLLKSIPLSHYGFLLQTFNDLLIRNIYPEHWKLSKMILFPKEKSSIISLDQTRPISLLPCLGKVYERCFLVYLTQWMKMNDILPPEQSGFREKHSTATRFVQFLQHIRLLINSGITLSSTSCTKWIVRMN